MAKDCRKTVKGSLLNLNGWTISQSNRKTKDRISFIWLILPIFFSLTLSLPWYLEIGPSRGFNRKHSGMGGRGVNHLFKFYTQGAFANKLQSQMAESRAVGGKVAFFKRDHLNNPFVFPPISHFSQEKSPDNKFFRNGKENTLAKGLCSTIVLLPGGCKRRVQNTEPFINVATMLCLTVKLLHSELPIISSLLSSHFLHSEMCTEMRKPEAHFLEI